MNRYEKIKTLSTGQDPTIQEIFDALKSEGPYGIIFFLTLPFLQPIPLVGVSSVIGLIMGLAGVSLLRNSPPYLPKRWAHKRIPKRIVRRTALRSDHFFKRIDLLVRPRWLILSTGSFEVINSLLLILHSILLSLPLPIPFSNALPAVAMFLNSLGNLQRDGVVIFLSYLMSLVTLGYFVAIAMGLRWAVSL